MKVLVADDHGFMRRGIRQVLEEEFSTVVVHEAHNGTVALEKFQRETFDSVVLDINLPDKNGIEVLKELKQIHPEIPIIVLSLYPEEQYALRAMRAGASSYLTKERAPEELVQAMKKVLQGGKYITESLGEKLVERLNQPVNDVNRLPHQILSDRELNVLVLIGKGESLTEISERLSISIKTVSTYRSRILEKLHLTSTAELIRYVIHYQLDT